MVTQDVIQQSARFLSLLLSPICINIYTFVVKITGLILSRVLLTIDGLRRCHNEKTFFFLHFLVVSHTLRKTTVFTFKFYISLNSSTKRINKFQQNQALLSTNLKYTSVNLYKIYNIASTSSQMLQCIGSGG